MRVTTEKAAVPEDPGQSKRQANGDGIGERQQNNPKPAAPPQTQVVKCRPRGKPREREQRAEYEQPEAAYNQQSVGGVGKRRSVRGGAILADQTHGERVKADQCEKDPPSIPADWRQRRNWRGKRWIHRRATRS